MSKFELLNKANKLYINITKNVIAKIPKVHTGIKRLINEHSFLIIEYIQRARVDKENKIKHINEIIIQINILQELIHLLGELKLISATKEKELLNQASEVLTITNGWLRKSITKA